MLKENYQNNAEATFMVQTRSKSKVKAAVVKKSSNSSNTEVQEIKPIIIDDTQNAPDSQKVIRKMKQTPGYPLNIHK